MPYIYNDEDNNPMNEDPIMKYTTYMTRVQMEFDESDLPDHFYYEHERVIRNYMEDKALDGLALVLGMSEGCRECPWFIETAEGFFDEDNQISAEQMDYLHLMCVGCKGKETGKINPEHEDRLLKEWKDLCEWVKDLIPGSGPKTYRCQYCPNVYRVYGKYKDPDDDWKAIEDLCCNCKHFGEV